ncbi:MAG TPA: hypothetical protein VKV36_08860 [Acidimicrobiales bacterium]|nr:hypothetical protein [Acidimicrobiales bacterium]
MSLWTPSGEHHVRREQPPGAPAGGTTGAGAPGTTRGDVPGRATASRGGGPGGGPAGRPAETAAGDVEQLRQELAKAPAEVVVANHCYGLFELAAVYLSQSPPLLAQARLAIDALGHLVDGLGSRLGDAHASLAEALAQIRLAYVRLDAAEKARLEAPAGGTDGAG